MIIYNHDETKMLFIPVNTSVSMECKLSKSVKFQENSSAPVLSLKINDTFIMTRLLVHWHDDTDDYTIGDFYTESEIENEICKLKGNMKILFEKLKYNHHDIIVKFTEDGQLVYNY